MTVPSATWRQQHSGNGATVAFTTGFPFLEDADVRVIHTDAEGTDTEWTLGTQFTLTGAHSGVPGTVTVITTPDDYTPQTDETLTILSDIPFEQALDGDALTTFPASSLEDALDAVWIGMNQLNEKLGRAVVAEETGDGSPSITSWTPVFAVVADGSRRVVQLVEWTGGDGDEPDGGYLGDEGLVASIGDATDIRGAAGAAGAGSGDMITTNNLSDVTTPATAFSNIKQAATTSATGVLEIATDAEALAKADTGRALVPSNLAAIGASTTFAGLVELATNGEAVTGSDTARAVTPAGVAAAIAAGATAFPAGTAMLFAQTAAPTGWTKSTTHNDKILRVVSGTASSGGSVNFSTFAARTTTDGVTLTGGYLPAIVTTTTLNTANTDPRYGVDFIGYVTIITDAVSTSIYSGVGTTFYPGIDCRIKYVDTIIATKD